MQSNAAEPPSRRWITVLCFVVSLLVVLLYGLPAWFSAGAAVVLGLAYRRGGPFAALTTTLTLVLTTGVYAVVIRVSGLEDTLYFRPHTKFAAYDYSHRHKAYKRNASTTMNVPHGGLQPMTNERLAQPRTVRFRTDSEGFRNDLDYHGQTYVLVGDSFIVGNGSDQDDTLCAQLKRNHGLDTYNLSYPGDPYDYLLYIDGFRRRHGEEFRVLLFLFEGNDFPTEMSGPDRRRWSLLESSLKRVRNLVADRSVYRVTQALYDRVVRREAIAGGGLVRVVRLGDLPFGLYASYIPVSERESYRPPAELEQILERMSDVLEHIFFIPTKYRVYHSHLVPGKTLPHAQWSALREICDRNGFSCTDLTPHLIRRAEELLPRGELIWWRDDSHWNRNGIAVAARVLAETVAGGDPAGTPPVGEGP